MDPNPRTIRTQKPVSETDVAAAEAAAAEAPPPSETRRDVQRHALQELVALSTEVTANEVQTDEKYAADLAANDKGLDRAGMQVAEREKSLRESMAQKHAERVAHAKGQYQQTFAALESAYKGTRQRVEHDKQTIDRDVKKNYEQAVWLAESVLEADEHRIAADFKKAREVAGGRAQLIDSLDDQAAAIVARFRQELPPPAPGDEALAEGEARPATFDEAQARIEERLVQLDRLGVPGLFVGVRPFFWGVGICVLAAVAAQGVMAQSVEPNLEALSIGLGAGALLCVILGLVFRSVARSRVRQAFVPLRQASWVAREVIAADLKAAEERREADLESAEQKRQEEVQGAKDRLGPLAAGAVKRREIDLAAADADFNHRIPELAQCRDQALADAEAWVQKHKTDLAERIAAELAKSAKRHAERKAEVEAWYVQARADLKLNWEAGLARINEPIAKAGGKLNAPLDWGDAGAWKAWLPPKTFAPTIRFGELKIDLKQITDRVPRHLALPPEFSVPAVLAFPRQASLLIHTDREGRPEAIRTLQMVMSRLLTNMPAGRVRFTIMDPVGLGQNFAGFMHLADHDENLVGARIWTEAEHIEQRLANLTEHMETVIQKYLRNEYETIDQYNAQAGELAEPYRFLVICDFPVAFQGDSFRRLASIASTGARCGVYTLIVRDTRTPLPGGAHMDDVEAHSLNLVRQNGRFAWKDDVFKQFPLHLDAPPSEEFLTGVLDLVGQHAKEANRVEVGFHTIAPNPKEIWTASSTRDLQVPIGRMGATRLQLMKMGRGVAQHALIAGKTGSGKSTLLHAMITNLAMWYSPDEVEFYLIDFKKGVEFKTYATHNLPHARAIAVESDREFGLSVLQRLDGELVRRGNLFRKLGVQDLGAYRETQGSDAALPMLPRTLLIIDEFQEFFSEDDKLAQDCAILLDRLVRQGRAFGIHVLLGSQTIGGSSGLARSTIGQIGIRIALQTSEADSQVILGDGNSAARLLSRPGEAIYNDAGGLVEANSPFQVAWLPDDQREVYLKALQERLHGGGPGLPKGDHPPAIVFEGNAPADITKNEPLANALASYGPNSAPLVPLAWLGDPVAIKDPTAIPFRRQSGANVLIIGQQEDGAMALLASALESLAAQQVAASFVVFDGSASDSPLARVFPRLKATVPNEVKLVEFRAGDAAMNEVAVEMQRRQAEEAAGGLDPATPSIYVIIYGVQRFRILRKSEESFGGFGMSGEEGEKKVAPDKQFSDLLREGPPLGIHVLAWADTTATLDRTFDRQAMREFDNRVLFQMSANDSSNLIDSPAGNKLGQNRALAYSEEQGTLEKFRPYALPSKDWLEHLHKHLRGAAVAAEAAPAPAAG